jgi:TatD DNase family protein
MAQPPSAMYIDSHAHLEGKRFDSDREQVLERARAAGIETILAIGIGDGPGTLDCAIKLAEQYPQLYATVGIHPHDAQLATDAAFQELERLSKHPKVIAWGEIGLDYFYDHSPRDVQARVFIRQMELARAAKLPIIIHCRPSDDSENAWDDTLAIIREHWASSGLGGILHCFTGGEHHARAALHMGFLISIAGNVTFPKAEGIRQVVKDLPLDRMLIETDSPFLAPIPHRGKRNEPAFVVEVAGKIAEIRGLAREEVASRTSENFGRFFSLPEKVNSI